MEALAAEALDGFERMRERRSDDLVLEFVLTLFELR